MKENKGVSPCNFSRATINAIAQELGKVTHFEPGEQEIDNYILNTLHGEITTNDEVNEFDYCGGSIQVFSYGNFKIFLSNNLPAKERNFTIAHELGHYVLHSKLGNEKIFANRSNLIDDSEKEANYFAHCFLLPENKLKAQYRVFNGDIIKLSDYFNVPMYSITFRCEELKLGM